MVVAFEGWNDAGEAASGAADHLTKQFRAVPFASIDPEDFFVFTETRPRVEIAVSGDRRVVWPATEFAYANLPNGRDVVIVRGTEPQLRWRTFCSLIISVAKKYRASSIITLGALLADVPHTRPTVVYGTSDDPSLSEDFDLSPSSYEGPTGIVGILNSACAEAGFSSASLWAAVPTYVPGTTSPKATLALAQRVAEVIGHDVGSDELEREAHDYERQISDFVAEDEDTEHWVRELEAHYDDEHHASADESVSAIDESVSPEQFVEQVEQFLRDQA